MTIPETLRALLDKTCALRAEVAGTLDKANEGHLKYTRELLSLPAEHADAMDALALLEERLEIAADKFGEAIADMEVEAGHENEVRAIYYEGKL